MKKIIYVLVLLAMSLMMVSCGGKNDSGGSSSSFSSDPYTVKTVTGAINVDNYIVTVGSTQYRLTQQGVQIADEAMYRASQQYIQLNGARQLKARITGSVQPQYNMGGNFPNQQQQQYGNNILNVSNIEIVKW